MNRTSKDLLGTFCSIFPKQTGSFERGIHSSLLGASGWVVHTPGPRSWTWALSPVLLWPWRPGEWLLSDWRADECTLLQLCEQRCRLGTPGTWGFTGNSHSSSPRCSVFTHIPVKWTQGPGRRRKTVRQELSPRKPFLLSTRKFWWWYYSPKACMEGYSSHSPKAWMRGIKIWAILDNNDNLSYVSDIILSTFYFYIYSPQ